jgi:hypothetical protein
MSNQLSPESFGSRPVSPHSWLTLDSECELNDHVWDICIYVVLVCLDGSEHIEADACLCGEQSRTVKSRPITSTRHFEDCLYERNDRGHEHYSLSVNPENA